MADAMEDFEDRGPDRLNVDVGLDPIAVEPEEQRVAIGIVRQPLRQRPIQQPVVELHLR